MSLTGDRDTVVRAAKAAGYTRINTAAGPCPLDEWNPYGATKGDGRMVSLFTIGFEFIDGDRPRIEDVITSDSTLRSLRGAEQVTGIWPLGK